MDNFDDKRLKGEVMPPMDVSVQDYENGDIYFMSHVERSRAEVESELRSGEVYVPPTPGPLNNRFVNFIVAVINLLICFLYTYIFYFSRGNNPSPYTIIDCILSLIAILLAFKKWDHAYFSLTTMFFWSILLKLFFIYFRMYI